MISISACSRFSIHFVFFVRSFDIVVATPPCLFVLFLVSQVWLSSIGGCPWSLVSVIQHMLQSYSYIAACRLFILPVIPFALVYIILSFISYYCFILFFVLVLSLMFLNRTVLLLVVYDLTFFSIDFACIWVVFSGCIIFVQSSGLVSVFYC